jgi:hypothetical protein
MINIDLEGFRALVWYYANIEGIITPKTWEKLMCKSLVGGIHKQLTNLKQLSKMRQ